MEALTPPGVAPPLARYAHGTRVPPNAAWVVTSGQLGIAPDGTVPPTTLEQARLCFRACSAILAQAGMTAADAVQVRAYVTPEADPGAYMRARDEWVGPNRPPASTLLVVVGFTRAGCMVEVEVVAARAG